MKRRDGHTDGRTKTWKRSDRGRGQMGTGSDGGTEGSDGGRKTGIGCVQANVRMQQCGRADRSKNRATDGRWKGESNGGGPGWTDEVKERRIKDGQADERIEDWERKEKWTGRRTTECKYG